MKGILLIDKPLGWTSFDVVNYVRKMVARIEGKKPRNIKVGHAGTLDPAATGLLLLAVGKEFTSQMPTLMKKSKTYEAEVTLGMTSTTDDKEGELTTISKDKPAQYDVEAALHSFVGSFDQLPPSFSALKVAGQRAYKLAREGKTVQLKARPVTIHTIEHIQYIYPKIIFTTTVGSGTYIRSLARDIGEKLGTGAYLSALRRTAIGDKNSAQALAISDLNEEVLTKLLA